MTKARFSRSPTRSCGATRDHARSKNAHSDEVGRRFRVNAVMPSQKKPSAFGPHNAWEPSHCTPNETFTFNFFRVSLNWFGHPPLVELVRTDACCRQQRNVQEK